MIHLNTWKLNTSLRGVFISLDFFFNYKRTSEVFSTLVFARSPRFKTQHPPLPLLYGGVEELWIMILQCLSINALNTRESVLTTWPYAFNS